MNRPEHDPVCQLCRAELMKLRDIAARARAVVNARHKPCPLRRSRASLRGLESFPCR